MTTHYIGSDEARLYIVKYDVRVEADYDVMFFTGFPQKKRSCLGNPHGCQVPRQTNLYQSWSQEQILKDIFQTPQTLSSWQLILSLPPHKQKVMGSISGCGTQNLLLLVTISSLKHFIELSPVLKDTKNRKLDVPKGWKCVNAHVTKLRKLRLKIKP